MPPDTFILTIALCAGYLAGSIPFGLLIPKLAGMGDVRDIGSGNIGATNVLRAGNKLVALLTLLADVLKGAIPVAMAIGYGSEAGMAAGLGALLGHIFPVWLRFKGGKGVATFIGVQFGLYWPVALTFLACWLVVALVFRYSSLSALAASALAPLWAVLLEQPRLAWFFVLTAAIIFVMHRANISRLMKGEELKIGAKSR